MQRNSNNNGCVHPACAACKHQRKKCSDECILASYFPANRSREFQAVHKVFGVSNVTKIVRNVKEEDRNKVSDSLIWEALCRQKDPVLGPYGEYMRIYEELKLYRNQELMQIQNQNHHHHQLLQQLTGGTQGGMINYKSAGQQQPQPLVGWNNEGGFVNNINNGLIYNNNHDHDGDHSIVDLDSYCYSSQFVQSPKKLKQEREVGSVVIPLQHQQQQHSIGFSQQYYDISDENYFSAEVIKCKDGSKSFTRDRLNDNFCDCIDGTDEPGTSACPAAKFYCRNIGSTPQFIFSSRVNDRICDCCDGSDEYDNSIRCPNTCVMGGNLDYKIGSHVSTISNLDSIDAKETKNGVNLEDLIEKLKGLKMVLILQVVLVSFAVGLRISYRRVRSKRRHNRWRILYL
ncbi:hypothetical protein EZV62_020332 [Acer yangbiense]|uniref:LOB domain-containing protein n=1 Tax=Acer yangbiense TaxID=1000413 RepID=A0A5C7HFV5_9ROSI|nr:hypothetical protein EZV62_020332 [Acer yangbiense]